MIPVLLLCLVVSGVLAGQGGVSRRGDDRDPLAVVVEGLSQALDALKAQVAAQQNEIAHLKAIHTSPIAFSAYISDEPRVHAAKGSAAPFRGVIVNAGNGYSSSSSAFTAPVAGLYFFIVHADCSSNFRSLAVTVNGNKKFDADNDGGDYHVTGSGVMSLRQGDVVTTRYFSDAGTLDAGPESTFSGFLVK